jgi:hypothetical protein
MDFTNWILTILIFIIIISFNLYAVFVSMYDDINDNWGEYKCNPSVMPFASTFGHDTTSNFYGCVQNTQSTFMSYMLAPINHGMNSLTDVGTQFQGTLQNVRGFVSEIRSKIVSIVEFIYGAFVNTVVEFQKLTISMRDLFHKIMGVIITFLYFVDGSIKALNSLWKGPVGGAVRTVQRFRLPNPFCFSRDTKIPIIDRISNETIYTSVDKINIGDTIYNTNVKGTVWLLNDKKTPMYSLKTNNTNIICTESHKIYLGDKLVPISSVNEATKIENNKDKYLYNFIMDSAIINIDGYNYSDWNEITLGTSQYLLKSNNLSKQNQYINENLHTDTTLVTMNDLTNKKHEDIIPGDILENNNLVFGVVKFINQNSDELQFILLTENDYYNKITLGTDTVKERVPNYNTLFNSILNIA